MYYPGICNSSVLNFGFVGGFRGVGLDPPRADHPNSSLLPSNLVSSSRYTAMARPPPRRSSRINAIQPSSPLESPTSAAKKRKYYVISDSEPPAQDSDSSTIQVYSRPPCKPKIRGLVSSAAKQNRSGNVSPKCASKRTKRKERHEDDGTSAKAAVQVGEKRKKDMRDVAVGPDESMWTSRDTQKDAFDIVQATFMDDITCSVCCIPPNLI